MATLAQLRASAKALGLPATDIRSATSADELQKLIVQHMNGGAAQKPARKPAAKTPARKAAKTPAKKAAAGRKPAAGRKTPVVKPKPAAKAKRPAAANGDAGRHMLTGIDYSDTEGWNPRPDSPPDLIVKSLRKHKGNRESVFKALVGNIKLYVGAKKQDGSTRTKAEREDMLRYRISRTAWDFAMKTGQHEKSDNRAEYGSLTATPAKKKPPVARKSVVAKRQAARKPQAAARPVKKKRAAARR